MSLLYKVLHSVTPAASDEERRQARETASAGATSGNWPSEVLEHHEHIEDAFGALKAAIEQSDEEATRSLHQELSTLLTGHANAEESVLYPALVRCDQKSHAEHAYSEQAGTKIQMAALEQINPLHPAFLAQLEHFRRAILQHMYEEESRWFPSVLDKSSIDEQVQLTRRFRQEFDRYTSTSSAPAFTPARPRASDASSSH